MVTSLPNAASNLLQRRDVVEHVEPTAMRRDDEIVVARVDLDVAHGHDRQVATKRDPVRAAIPRDPQSQLAAEVQEVVPVRILTNDMAPAGGLRQITNDRLPGATEVGRHEHVRRVVIVLVMIRHDVRGARRVARRLDRRNPRVRREARHVPEDVRPRLPTVARDLDVPIVRADPDHVRVERRRRNGEQRTNETPPPCCR